MRLLFLACLFSVAFYSTDVSAYSVLLPEDSKEAPSANMGLVPREAPPASVPVPAPSSGPLSASTPSPAPVVLPKIPLAQGAVPSAPTLVDQPAAISAQEVTVQDAEMDGQRVEGEEPEISGDEAPSVKVSYQSMSGQIQPGGVVARAPLTEREKILNGFMASGMAPVMDVKTPMDSQIQLFHSAQKRKYGRPVTIIDDNPIPVIENAAYDKALALGVNGSYAWGAKDVGQIALLLGYDAKDVPQNCQLRMDATVETDKESSLHRVMLLAGKTEQVAYAGELRNVKFVSRAVCRKPQGDLPESGGIIMRSGEYYVVQLPALASCSVAAKTSPRSLEIQYQGDGQVRCLYK